MHTISSHKKSCSYRRGVRVARIAMDEHERVAALDQQHDLAGKITRAAYSGLGELLG